MGKEKGKKKEKEANLLNTDFVLGIVVNFHTSSPLIIETTMRSMINFILKERITSVGN